MKWIDIDEEKPPLDVEVLLAVINVNDNSLDVMTGFRYHSKHGIYYISSSGTWKLCPMYWAKILPPPKTSKAAIKRIRKENKI